MFGSRRRRVQGVGTGGGSQFLDALGSGSNLLK